MAGLAVGICIAKHKFIAMSPHLILPASRQATTGACEGFVQG